MPKYAFGMKSAIEDLLTPRTVRLTGEDWAQVEELARRDGHKPSSWLRYKLRQILESEDSEPARLAN